VVYVISGVGFWPRLLGPAHQPLEGFFTSRLKSESFEPLIGFLAFLLPKLWKTYQLLVIFTKHWVVISLVVVFASQLEG